MTTKTKGGRLVYHNEHWSDDLGRPTGGVTTGTGFTISWQNGPMRHPDGSPKDQNGAFVEDLLEAVAARIGYYQTTPFKCPENELALQHLGQAIAALESRTRSRQARGVEGTHAV